MWTDFLIKRAQPIITAPITRRLYSSKPSLIAPSVASTIKSEAPQINHSQIAAFRRKWLPKRCGALLQKVGMISHFDVETGKRVGCTVLRFDNVEVIMHRTLEKNGCLACQVGYGNKSPRKVSRQLLGHYAAHLVNPKVKVAEFKVANEKGLLPLGTLIKPSFFRVGDFLDARAISKGKGFAGVMKKYHFKGLRASHGTSLMHRHGGSYGQNQDPGRVLPGKKMPGRMGGHQVTVQNVEIMKVDDANNVIWVKGAIPGANGTFVRVQDAIKKPPKDL